jgi:gamma-glutamyltranspeptidase/glutathione hydrolase
MIRVSPRAKQGISLLAFALFPAGLAAQSDTGIVSSKAGMVVSTSSPASDVGRDSQTGGNAIDAAVATAFALAVTHPSAGNIGGGVSWYSPGERRSDHDRLSRRRPLASTPDDVSGLDRQDRATAHRTGYLAPACLAPSAGWRWHIGNLESSRGKTSSCPPRCSLKRICSF